MARLTYFHGALSALAADLFKIANDIRFLGSGPRSGPRRARAAGKRTRFLDHARQGEPDTGRGADHGRHPASWATRTTVEMAASQGHFELNVFKPVIADAVLQSVRLAGDAMRSFADNCVRRNRGQRTPDRRPHAAVADAGDGAGAEESATTTRPRSPRPRTRTVRTLREEALATGPRQRGRITTRSCGRRRWCGRVDRGAHRSVFVNKQSAL